MPSDINILLKRHPSLKYDDVSKKVRCSLSGHEMPYKIEAVTSYVNGKRYLKLKDSDDKNFEKYKPHLVPSTKKHHEHQLFSVLMMTHVNKTVAHVERHVNGTKFKRRLKLWEECQRTGTEYRPPKGRRKVVENPDLRKGVSATEDGASKDVEAEDEVSDTDSLSDLYPAKSKHAEEAEEDDDDNEDDNDDNDETAEGSKDNINDDDDNVDDSDSDFEFEQLDEPAVTQSKPIVTTPSKPTPKPGQKREGEKLNKKKKKKQKFS